MKIKCLVCNTIIESKHIHNLVVCKCNNCYVDGEVKKSEIENILFDNMTKEKIL